MDKDLAVLFDMYIRAIHDVQIYKILHNYNNSSDDYEED